MPQELNSPIPIPQLLVGLWSTLRLVAGSAPVGWLGGVGGGVAVAPARLRLEKVEVGDGTWPR